jgi:hypothetical protein
MPVEKSERKQYEEQRQQLDNERQSWVTHWRELSDFILPRRSRFLASDRNRGERRSKNIIDGTATDSAIVLQSGLMSGVTSPARLWFELATADPVMMKVASVRRWLADVTEVLRGIFEKSNLYNALPTLYGDMGVFGTGVMLVLDDDRDVIRCYTLPVGSYWLSNNERLEVDKLFRETSMTVRQMVNRFGIDNVSDSVKTMWKNNQRETWQEVIQVIGPNDDYKPESPLAKHKKFESCYYEKNGNDDKTLGESGFDEFPGLCGRWDVTGEDVYGNSPAMNILGDVKSLQLYEKKTAKAVDKMVDPPLVGPSSVAQRPVSLLPGAVTVADVREGMQGLRPIHEVKFDISHAEMKAEGCRQRIKSGMFTNLFLMLANDQRSGVTATEIMQRQEEKMLMLGPVLERLNDEILAPLIDRTFAIAYRRGLIPEAPPEMHGVELKVEYSSIMAAAQRLLRVGGVDRWVATVGNMAQARPTVLDKVDEDKVADFYSDALSVPPDLSRSDDEVAAIRQGRAQQQQQAQQAANLANVAKGAQLLSQTDTRGENALTDILGQQTGARL